MDDTLSGHDSWFSTYFVSGTTIPPTSDPFGHRIYLPGVERYQTVKS